MAVLSNKVAIVTGAGKGIALAMAKERAIVAVIDLNPSTAKSTAAEISGSAPYDL